MGLQGDDVELLVIISSGRSASSPRGSRSDGGPFKSFTRSRRAFRIAVQVLTALEDWSGLLTRYESLLDGHEAALQVENWLAMARLAHTKPQDTELAPPSHRAIGATGAHDVFAELLTTVALEPDTWCSIRDEWLGLARHSSERLVRASAHRQPLRWYQEGDLRFQRALRLRFGCPMLSRVTPWLIGNCVEAGAPLEVRRDAFERQSEFNHDWPASAWLNYASTLLKLDASKDVLSSVLDEAFGRCADDEEFGSHAAISEAAGLFDQAVRSLDRLNGRIDGVGLRLVAALIDAGRPAEACRH